MDLYIIETENGGDAILSGNDLIIASGYESLVYMSLFGGSDWYGNDLFFQNTSEKFTCTTEDVMRNVALNSSGRITIENAVKNDLAYISKELPGTVISVSVAIVSDDQINVDINLQGEEISQNWNPYIPPKPNSRQIFFGQFTAVFTIQFTRNND